MDDDRKRDLTEQAHKAFEDEWYRLDYVTEPARHRRALDAALAVFEAAQKPTDDEREELRDAIDHIQGAVEFQDAINPQALRLVIAAARRRLTPGVRSDVRDDMIAWLLREQTNDLSPLGRDYTDAELAEALRRSAPPGPNMPSPAQRLVDNRDPECVKAWPECETFGYDPRCCRFPKSCSAGGWAPEEQAANHENGSER